MFAQGLGLVLAFFAFADEPKSGALMQTLPADGAWVTFDVNVKLHMTHRVFRHRDVPFGIAGMQQELKSTFGGQEQKISIRVSLRDHGKDAKAKLPDLMP